jgi:short subunit dehydrogenase-like uncharacterized protein
MSSRAEWMIYGANGYTGHLVAAEARRRGLNPVLAGRRAGPIEKLAAELGLPMKVFDLDDAGRYGCARGHGGRRELRWPIRSDQCSDDRCLPYKPSTLS